MSKPKHAKSLVHKTNGGHERPVPPWPDYGLLDEFRHELSSPLSWMLNRSMRWPAWDLADWRSPASDVRDVGTHYEVVAELPGIPKEKVEVRVFDDKLEIRGEATKDEATRTKAYFRREIGERRFLRSFVLPSEADPGDVEAAMRDGRLTVRIGKRPIASVSKRVPVR